MKRVGCILLCLLAMATPACPEKKITVGQLEDLLRSFEQDKKSDGDVANALKQIDLAEELTVSKVNSLIRLAPGRLSAEQIYVLEAKSADLIPPAADLPHTPDPDAAAQATILARATNYVTRTYDQLPGLAATRITLRFQDDMETLPASSGINGSAAEVDTNAGFSHPATYVHYINSTEVEIASTHGIEKLPPEKDKIHWGANKMIALETPAPGLGEVFKEARASGDIRWLRWELINGKQTAVFAFSVPRKRSRMEVNVCCFPTVEQAGVATFYSAATAGALSGGTSTGGGGVAGNFQTTTHWNDYKATVPFQGEFFIDPDTGVVSRMITEAELKPSEVVHHVDTRIDYGEVNVGNKALVAPVKTFIDTEVVPHGDSGAGGYTTRRTLFTSEYKNYRETTEMGGK